MKPQLIIWECPMCDVHHRVSAPPKPVEHCDDCQCDVRPVIVYDSKQ